MEVFHIFIYLWRGAQIPDARSTWRLNLVRWRLMFEGPQCGTSCIAPFWRLEIYIGVQNCGDICAPLIYDLFSDAVRNSAKTDFDESYERSERVVENRTVSR